MTAGKGFMRAGKGQLIYKERQTRLVLLRQLYKGPSPGIRGAKLLEIGIWWYNRVKRKLTQKAGIMV